MADDRELKLKVKVDDQASRPLGKIGDAADDTTADFAKMNLGLKKLDDKLSDTKKTLADLRTEVGKSGDLDLLKDIQKQEQRLKALTRQRKSLVGDGGKEAVGFAAQFTAKLGPLLAKAPVSPPLLGAFAGAAAALVPVVAGAVTAGVAAASVGIGLKIAFSDPGVAAAAEGLKKQIGDELKTAARPFVPEAKKAIGIVRDEFHSIRPVLDDLFADSARYVQPLTRSVTGFTKEVIKGARDANREAGPLVETLGEHGPKAGRAFGDVLRSLSKDSEATAQSIDGLLTSVEFLVTSVGKVVEWGNKFGLLGSPLMAWIGTLGDSKEAAQGAADGAEEVGNEIHTAGGKAATAATQVRSLRDILLDFAGKSLDSRAASRELEAAIDDATASLKENGKTLDVNTPKGRANSEALDRIATAANAASTAILAETGDQRKANTAAEEGRAKFIQLAVKMGMSRDAAIALANKLIAIPNVTRTVKINDSPAQAAIRRVQQSLGKIKDIHRGIYYTAQGDLKLPGGTQMKHATGGPIEGPGPKGVDSVSILAAPGEHVITAAEVDAAGGHAAIERWRRNLRNPGTATAGGGMAAGGGGGASVIQINATGATGLERMFLSWLVKAIVDAGGNPKVLGLGGRW